jgi:hypothetical protein
MKYLLVIYKEDNLSLSSIILFVFNNCILWRNVYNYYRIFFVEGGY